MIEECFDYEPENRPLFSKIVSELQLIIEEFKRNPDSILTNTEAEYVFETKQ